MSWCERSRALAPTTASVLAICVLAGLVGAASSGGTVERVALATQRALAAARNNTAHWRPQTAAEHDRATTAVRRSTALNRALRRARAATRTWKTRAQRAHRHHAHRRVHHE